MIYPPKAAADRFIESDRPLKMITKIIFLFAGLISSGICLEENPRILIIGAGPSGIAAATRLWKANFTNLKILEAENRIGGRVNSVKFGDSYVDLGGQWCHGEKGNVVNEMMKEYDVLRPDTLTIKLVYSNGSYLDDEIGEELTDFMKALEKRPEIREKCRNFSSAEDCINNEFQSTFQHKFRNDPDKLRATLDAWHLLESAVLDSTSSPSLSNLSLDTAYVPCEGKDLHWDGRGYKTILEVMMQKFSDPTKGLPIEDRILLNREVRKISWNHSDSTIVTIQTTDNSSFEAEHVIFTPSLGVLKHDHGTLFEPELPEEKIGVIETAGFGAVLKIILHFPEAWWDTQEYALVWSAEDMEKIKSEYGKGPEKASMASWLTTLSAILPAVKNPKVLVLFYGGSMIPEIERTEDQVLLDGVMYTFRKFFGKNCTVKPDKMLKTSWHSNPHFRGTYSYDSVNGNSKEYKFPEKLGAPLTRDGRPVVQFAGEATNPHHFATVHGAIESGYREADRLIKLYETK
ncbi:hypothetical protein NQ317_019006 [Molorchus minor]|uniref:Amine oxidase domain-containing protein n=1 Tax=Molorchus minor TaxID=1323400 RepID=A0ABQ9JQ36_9CUCU|nr:hypothetical protein NQ317_019006 [Molorchus minor]